MSLANSWKYLLLNLQFFPAAKKRASDLRHLSARRRSRPPLPLAASRPLTWRRMRAKLSTCTVYRLSYERPKSRATRCVEVYFVSCAIFERNSRAKREWAELWPEKRWNGGLFQWECRVPRVTAARQPQVFGDDARLFHFGKNVRRLWDKQKMCRRKSDDRRRPFFCAVLLATFSAVAAGNNLPF